MSEDVAFGRKEIADSFRDEHPDALCSQDDRRLKTVTFASDAPDDVVEEARQAAAQSRGDRESTKAQAELSRQEKKRLDFSKDGSSVLKAQWVKGTLNANGIKDWQARYDPTLTVDEHVSMLDEWKRDQQGSERLDAEETEDEANARRARQAQEAQNAQCNHARDECEHGDPEACEFLGDACGFDDEEIEAILSEETAEDGDLPGHAYGALSKLWTQYKTGLADVKEAAAGINEVRQQHGQDPLGFDELGGEEITRDTIDA
jgi:hypothetical protein